MSRYIKRIWPACNTGAVCAVQSTAGAANLKLNGTLANVINSEVSFVEKGFIRQVSITSTANLSALTITVTGMQNGVIVTENIVGPNNTTVYGDPTKFYDVITSVSINGAAANITVGTGYCGFFPLIGIDLNPSVINYTLSIASLTAENVTTEVFSVNEDIYQNGNTFKGNATHNNNIFIVKEAGTELQYQLPDTEMVLCKSFLVEVKNVEADVAKSLSLTFIQV